MTLEDLEQHNKGFIDFRFCDFGLWLLLQEWIVPISLELNQNNLHMKFSVLNVDFNSPSLQPLFKETCARGYSTGYTRWTIFLLNLSRIFLFFFTLFARIFSPFARFFHRVLPESGGGVAAPAPPAPTPMYASVPLIKVTVILIFFYVNTLSGRKKCTL